jgi:CubicO group peptidase (beta-lactamase class C family)
MDAQDSDCRSMQKLVQCRQKRFIFAVMLALVTAGCSAVPQTGCYKREGLDPKIVSVIDAFRASVPETMKKGKVPGSAFALLDAQGIIWTEGFGYTNLKRKIPVTPDTSFLICSMSKTFTATAVLLAVQDGLVDLDEPITTYLPDFKVNSRYEDHPEQKITLRHLLSHTAGLPREAVVGNNFELTCSFEEHVRSVYGNWLRHPVGQAYCYGNVHMDLAAYILQVVSGVPFEQYMDEHVFGLLRMHNSTVDSNEILSNSDRAIGHTIGIAKNPPTLGLLGAGGVSTSAADLARFVQMNINKGIVQDKRFLSESLIDAMYAPHGYSGANEPPEAYYGLGIGIERRKPKKVDLILYHAGSGLGFSALMHWYPEYGIGAVALTNRGFNPVLGELAFTITDILIERKVIEKRFQFPWPQCATCVGPWWGWPGHHEPTPFRPEWRSYCGTYRFRFSGYKLKWWAKLVLALGLESWTPRIKVREKDGFLCVTESKFLERAGGMLRAVNDKLQEVKPGLFMNPGGASLDFTGEVPTWRNYRLKKR